MQSKGISNDGGNMTIQEAIEEIKASLEKGIRSQAAKETNGEGLQRGTPDTVTANKVYKNRGPRSFYTVQGWLQSYTSKNMVNMKSCMCLPACIES